MVFQVGSSIKVEEQSCIYYHTDLPGKHINRRWSDDISCFLLIISFKLGPLSKE